MPKQRARRDRVAVGLSLYVRPETKERIAKIAVFLDMNNSDLVDELVSGWCDRNPTRWNQARQVKIETRSNTRDWLREIMGGGHA